MGEGCKIQGSAYIADDCHLGDGVFVGPSAVILNDKYPPSNDRAKWQPVQIGNHAVIGGNATIIPGNHVGERSVLAAGAVLTKDLPADEVWGGNPAKFMMTRQAYEKQRGAIH
jgi:acetyltransferase-like isoleucine patch superfamily enzyme